jgi:hypothetical protein
MRPHDTENSAKVVARCPSLIVQAIPANTADTSARTVVPPEIPPITLAKVALEDSTG